MLEQLQTLNPCKKLCSVQKFLADMFIELKHSKTFYSWLNLCVLDNALGGGGVSHWSINILIVNRDCHRVT
jgi:hypothetical protein